jgi:hypothetical protein
MKIITIPKTPRSAYDPARPASDLLKAHVANMQAVVHGARPGASPRRPRTEAQASAYLAEMTAALHPQAHRATRTVPPDPVLPNPAAPSPVPERSARPRRTRKNRKT